MRTIEDSGGARSSRRGRLLRDARVIWRVVTVVWAYAVPGRVVRSRYRRAARRGGIFYVDEDLPR